MTMPGVAFARGASGEVAVEALSVTLDSNSGAKLQSGPPVEETIVIAAAASSLSVANLIPANSMIKGIAFDILTAVPGCTAIDIGDEEMSDRYARAISPAAGTHGTSWQAASFDDGIVLSPFINGADRKIVITPDVQPSDATGRIKITVFYEQLLPRP